MREGRRTNFFFVYTTAQQIRDRLAFPHSYSWGRLTYNPTSRAKSSVLLR